MTDAPAPLWAFVPLAEHHPPAIPVRSTAVKAWSGLRQLLLREPSVDSPARHEKALRTLSDKRLAHLVRPIDWVEVSQALDLAIADAAGVTFVIGQPHSGHDAIVRAWAERHGARLIEPPTPAQILNDDPAWLPPGRRNETAGEARAAQSPESNVQADEVWALPRLERCFLRHTDGLALMRGLPDDLFERVLPMPSHQAMALLLQAQRQGLVEPIDGCWQVAPLAYMTVRTWLRGREFLTDKV